MENTKEITYSGYLYNNGAQEITLVYGFGDSWDYTTEQKMEKNDNGFVTNITIKDGYDKINYCFRSNSNEWDNNYGNNFSETIEKVVSEDLNDEDLNSLIDELDKFLNENINENFDSSEIEVDDFENEKEECDIEKFVDNFDLDALINNILEPVTDNTSHAEVLEEPVAVKKDKIVEKYLISPRKLGKAYLFRKRIKLAFYKLSVAIPKLLFGESED